MAVCLSGHRVQSSGVQESTLFLTHPSSSFTQGTVLYSFQSRVIGQSSVFGIEFQEACPNDTFSMDRNTGMLSIIRTIDYSQLQSGLEPVCVQSRSSEQQEHFITLQTFYCFVTVNSRVGIPVVINVIPELSTAELTFPQTFYSSHVVEGVANATVTIAGQLQAVSQPIRDAIVPNYRIIGEHSNDFMVVQSHTNCKSVPTLVTLQPLYLSLQSYYNLTLEAYTSTLSARTTIGVQLLDVNDESPQFVSAPELLTLHEDTPIGVEFSRFMAIDMDIGLNSKVRYSIPDSLSLFSIHPLSGSLFLFLPIATPQSSAQLTISATDLGAPPRSIDTNVTVSIESSNVFPPAIIIHSLRPVAERAPLGLVVGMIEVMHSNLSSVSIALVNNGPCECFRLSDATTATNGSLIYDVTVSGALDFETTPNGIHEFTLNATDAQFSTVEQEAIEITNVNEAPAFSASAYTVEVFEGIPVGSKITRIMATDPDKGLFGVLTYNISGSDPNRNLLAVHSSSGTIYSTGELNYENVSSIRITLTAQDSQQEEATATVTINILDRNDNIPVFTSAMNSSVTIPETQGVNQQIFHFTVSDVDSGCNGAVEYSIIHAEPQVFRIDSFSGLLFPMSESALDYETFQSAKVVVRATDLGSNSRYSIESSLFISLTDVDDEAPVIDPVDCPCFIREDISATAECSPLSAQDKDSASIQFSIVSGNDLGLFRINPSGVISTTQALNRGDHDSFILSIIASDGSQMSQPETLTIIIVDVNEPPMYPSTPISISIPQNLNVGDFVGNVAAMDSDVGFNSITLYEFQTGTSSTVTSAFHLDRLSGDLFTRASLSSMMYTFTVVASDITDSSSSASAMVTINVAGLKNNPPSFTTSSDRRVVPADLPPSSFIAQLSAMDFDNGASGLLTYSIVAGNHSGLFSVNSSGAIITAQSLSSSAGNVYVMNISATDSGFPQLSAYQEFILEIYATTTTVAGVQLVHNPAVSEICHFNNSLREMTDATFEIASLPSIGSQGTTYTVLPSNISSAFQIIVFSSTESLLQARRGFHTTVFINRELLFLTLRAQYGNNFHLCSVTVIINDVNNNPALFVSDSFSIDVYSGTPVGSSVYQLEAVDGDVGTNAQMQFALPSSSGLPFTLDRDSGVLTLSGSLDQSSYMFSATVTDTLYRPHQTSTATVQVTVLQTTNTPPVLSTIPSLNITETTPVGHVIAMLSVTDPDAGVHGENRFCILSGNEYNLFRVTRSGQLVVHRELDYESFPRHYDLTIRVHDTSDNPQYVDTSVSIDITDENDEAPVFSTNLYTATLMENQMSGLHVITVSAVDRDDGVNGEVRYSLSSSFPFTINAHSGVISVTSILDREATSMYTITVTATDQAAIESQRLSSSAELRVFILDENDESPVFITPSNTRHNVREDSAIGSEIIQLLASDDDEGANAKLKYSIVSGNDDFTFSIDPWTGSLSLARSLDFESSTISYVLTFQVTDLGAPARSAISALQLIFDVTDVNDNYPVFSINVYECSFMEPRGMSAVFDSNCQVGATDADGTSSNVVYSIVNPAAGLPFQIHPQSGVLSIIGLTDAEIFSRYVIKVQATDSGTPSLSTTALVVVTVRDANDNVAVFGDPISTLYIPELTPDNSLLFFAHALDRDLTIENSNISYQVLRGNGFRIHPRSGAVFLDGTLDAEESEMHELTILGVDPVRGSSSQRTFNIRVVDINENLLPPTFPVERNPSVVITSRAATQGTPVTTLTAIDIEGGTISYHIIGGSGYGYFHIGTSNGSIAVSYPLTSVEDDDLSLIIIADDGGHFPLTTEFRLTVVLEPDENAKPFFVTPIFYANPSESTASEEIIIHVRAEVNGYADPSICYSITDGNQAGMFAINTSTGAVYKSLVGNLDREFISSYNLTVTASKSGVDGTSTALLVIELADANDFRPRFVSTNFNISVFETHAVDPAQPFVRVFAIDNDSGENGRLSYSMQSAGTVPFNISETSGYVYLTSSLDTASASSYTVTVVARDHGAPALDGMTTLIVSVISPAPVGAPVPFFTQIPQQEISEGAAPGTMIVIFAPQNPLNTLFYRFMDNNDKFAISPNSGEVFLTSSLDHETQSSAFYTIVVTDGSNVITLVLPIVVLEVNEHRPQFTQEEFQLTVMENLPSNQTFGSITATDPESAVVYSLVDSQDPRSLTLFDVSSEGSVHTLFSEIDHEEIPVHILTVAARDFGDTPLLNFVRLIINVLDENDNRPTFEDTEIFIPEDTPISTSIFQVTTFDPDEGENAQVQYSLVSTNPLFLVNSTSGDIILTSSLDAETQQQHTLVISASNSDGTQTSQAYITVNVIDVLDSTPVLLNPGTVTVQENLPSYTFVTSLADTSNNSRPVFYSIVDGNTLGHFFIEPLTGILRTTMQLDREAVQSYQLTVQGAFESGFETNVSLAVNVVDVNDQTPQFPSSYLSYSIPENASVNVPLVNLNATDPDEDSNALYVISDGFAASIFSVDASGWLMLIQNLDRESQFTSITFEIYVIDTDYPNSYSSALVHIEVIDSNDNSPQFQHSEYNFTISTPTYTDLPFPGVQVTATDPDEGVYAEVRYEISGGNGTTKFGIISVTGEITVTNNYQLQPQYSLTVSAIDGGGLRSSVEVTIFIEACGFQNLLFLPATFTIDINENAAMDTDVITPVDLNVLIFDEPAQLVFSLPLFNPVFDIDSQTGRVFTDGEVDREENEVHYLVLQVEDALNPQRLAQAEIEVRVMDVNDNHPVFQAQNYVASVLNTATPGTEVIRVSALDDDIGTNSDIVYSLINASESFRIDPDSGAIFVNSTLNTAQLGSSVTLTTVATDQGNPPRSVQINVVIDIVDSNAPRFTRSVYQEEVSEGIDLGSTIVTVAVNVSSNNPSITFRLDSDDPFLPLSLGFFDGVVTVVDPGFDYESVQSYTVSILAEDSTTSLTGQARLEITILDENDNMPIFDAPGSFYTVNINENVDTGTRILQVSASDMDSPINAQITYRLDPDSQFLNTFSVASSDGVIRTIGNLDYEQYPVYELEIMAEDSGVPQRTGLATVRIVISNLNDNPPVFTASVYQDTVSQTARVGTGLLFVTATDPDRLSPVRYAIVPSGTGHENFAINSNGLISISRTLSGSSVFMYTLNISASDGELYGYTTVIIEVEISNDHSPVFNQTTYTGSVLEGSSSGTYVTQVFASDNDRGSNAEITYSLSDDLFSINPQSGIITTAFGGSIINREVTPSYQFSVVARDGGGRIGTARVDVIVEDRNDNAPQFLQTDYNISIIESVPTGTPVLSLDVSDADVGENSRLIFTAFPINVQPSQFPFVIDNTGLIRVSIPLDFTVVTFYTFNVGVRDNGTVPLSAGGNATVTVHILDDTTNNPPRFLEATYAYSIPETTRLGDSIGVIEVDATTRMNCFISYAIVQILDGRFFSIASDPVTEIGTISLAGSVITGDYNILVEAQCLDPVLFTRISSSIIAPTIQVYDVNTHPTFNNFVYSGIIPENSSLSTPVPLTGFRLGSNMPASPRDIEAEDGDSGVNGTVIYLIPNRESLMIPFDIGLTDGIIRVTGELDFETISTYTIVVVATDGGTPALSAMTTVTIAVTDVNDSPPEFERPLYRVEIPEDTAINTVIRTVQASDNDTSAVITYRLSGEVFTIDEMTGEISTAQSLDREEESIYTLLVLANDGLFSDNATVVISISDVNDNRPIFNESIPAFSLVENYPTGETIVQVFATDADEGVNANITYGIAEQPDNGQVTIDPSTGEVSFLMSPDFEISPRLEFQVRASDIGGLQDFTTIAINLLDLNDNTPKFTSQSYSASVIEHSGETNVIRVEAIDADSGINGSVSYTIEGDAAGDFTISTTGVVITQRAFDREVNPFFDIIVTASDSFNLSSSVVVRVNITDINDQRPIFPQSVYRVSVSEAEPANYVILMTTATDNDVGNNARITYALSGENHNEFRRESHANGSVSIVLANQLNRERLASYNITLRAIDGGIPQMDSTAIILVTVLDVNDNCPEFREPRYSEMIPENITVGTIILSVEAFDRDTGGQTQLIYSIRDASQAPEISINPDTGDISIASSLNFETRTVYTLMIDISDGDENCQPTPAIVNITLSDVNDEPPYFFSHEETYSINENNNPNVLLTTFSADDRDTVSVRGRITFSIEAGNMDDAFIINSVSGDLRAMKSLDREQIAMYNLVISAADNGSPSLTGTTNVTIIVNDLNDNGPTGGRQDIYIYLLNGTAPLITLGQVYVNDSDVVNDHSFMIQNTNGALVINANDGSIRIGTTTPELGTHLFQVMITDADNTPAQTNITVRIQSISESTLENSFVMQFDNISPQAFTDLVLANFLSRVAAVVSSTLQIDSVQTPIEIQVFSIQESLTQSTNVDIIVAARNLSSGTYIHPELVQHIIQVNEEDLENSLGVSIHTELVDLCRDSSCDSSQVCSNTYSYSSTNSESFGTRSVTYLGLTSVHSTTCSEILPSPCDSIACPEPSYCTTEREEAFCYDDCSREPCLNGGRCILQNSGYYCVCPNGYDGRNCEQTSATFTEETYAVFPLSNSRLEGSFSIEFITANRNGLLAFVGRYDNDFSDFISIELIDGRPSLRVSYGSDSLLLQLEVLFNDQQWHTISVQYNSTVSTNNDNIPGYTLLL